MNVEELFTEMKDPAAWNAKPQVRTSASPARRINPLVLSFGTVALVAVVAIILFGVFSSSIRAIKPPIVPAQSPTPTVAAAIPDDGRIVTEDNAGLARDDTPEEKRVDPAGLVSVPWVIVSTFDQSESIYIARVGGVGDDPACGAPAGIDVVETPDTVTLTAFMTPPDPDTDCSGEPQIVGGQFFLDYILKDRQLIHGALSAPWDSMANAIETRENPNVDPEPEPTKEPVLQDKVYVTSEGIGGIRIGQPAQDGNGVATWVDDGCGGTPGQPFAGHWQIKKPFDKGANTGYLVADIVTSNGLKSGKVERIIVRSPEIPTKSGARVGDSLESLLERFPDIGEPTQTDNSQAYIVEGEAGKVVFDVSEKERPGMGETAEYVVKLIRILANDEDVNLPSTDTYGSCHG